MNGSIYVPRVTIVAALSEASFAVARRRAAKLAENPHNDHSEAEIARHVPGKRPLVVLGTVEI